MRYLLILILCATAFGQTWYRPTFINAGTHLKVRTDGGSWYCDNDTLTKSADTLKFKKGLISDSTTYVLKRFFVRGDTAFAVINTDTFYLHKK